MASLVLSVSGSSLTQTHQDNSSPVPSIHNKVHSESNHSDNFNKTVGDMWVRRLKHSLVDEILSQLVEILNELGLLLDKVSLIRTGRQSFQHLRSNLGSVMENVVGLRGVLSGKKVDNSTSWMSLFELGDVVDTVLDDEFIDRIDTSEILLRGRGGGGGGGDGSDSLFWNDGHEREEMKKKRCWCVDISLRQLSVEQEGFALVDS
jgi:hypothetical protein